MGCHGDSCPGNGQSHRGGDVQGAKGTNVLLNALGLVVGVGGERNEIDPVEDPVGVGQGKPLTPQDSDDFGLEEPR